MLEKPNFPDEDIIELLESNYRLNIDALEFLPIGNDQRAWAYRAFANSGDCFLKLRKGGTRQAALVAPHELRRMGIDQALAPLSTISGDLRVSCEDFDLILYPYIDGRSAWGMSLAPAQARRWGEIMRRIHSAALSPAIIGATPREVFGVKWLPKIARVEEVITSGDFNGDVAAATAQEWREQEAEIELCRNRYLELGAQLSGQPPPFALCHADIHTANIIIDADERIWIVDWDETVIAPRERDLMFFVLDGHASDFTEAFFAGYGDDDINWLALAYYKYDWVIQEFGDYGERVFLSTELGEQDLQASLREFKRLFASDDVIARAHRAFAIFQKVTAEADADIG